jgi:Rrf2 family protein
MLCLAGAGQQMSRTIPEISQSEGITRPNVAKMLSILRRAGFVESVRGQNGGYILAREPEQIFISEILSALGSPLFDIDFCDHFSGVPENCNHLSSTCSLAALWGRMQNAVDKVVDKLTLFDLQHQHFSIDEDEKLLRINY